MIQSNSTGRSASLGEEINEEGEQRAEMKDLGSRDHHHDRPQR